MFCLRDGKLPGGFSDVGGNVHVPCNTTLDG